MDPRPAIPAPAVTAALTRAVSSSYAHEDRSASLPRRFLASCRDTETTLAWSAELDAACREGVADLRKARRNVEKAFDAAAECERVRAAQLAAYAHFIGDASAYEEEEGEVAVQCALTLLAGPDLQATMLRLDVDAVDAVMDKGVYVRDGVDPSSCVASGLGLVVYVTRKEFNLDNEVCVRAVDACGSVVESVEEKDVRVSVKGDGVYVSVRRVEGGVFRCLYSVLDREAVTGSKEVTVSVCGTGLAGSPWMVQVRLGEVAGGGGLLVGSLPVIGLRSLECSATNSNSNCCSCQCCSVNIMTLSRRRCRV